MSGYDHPHSEQEALPEGATVPFCGSCGAVRPFGAHFCPLCGAPTGNRPGAAGAGSMATATGAPPASMPASMPASVPASVPASPPASPPAAETVPGTPTVPLPRTEADPGQSAGPPGITSPLGTAPPPPAPLPRPRAWLLVAAAGLAALLAAAGAYAAYWRTLASPAPVTTVTVGPTPGSSPTAPSTAASASASASSFSVLYKEVADGVIRIETTACDGGGVGSGFLIAPDRVATVAHVVDGAVSVVLRVGGRTTTGTVVGIDRARDLALVRAAEPLPGHVFALSGAQPDVGSDVAAIGYPLAGEESLTRGTVSGLDRPVDLETLELTGLIQTDTAINPGNSGGPLLTLDGTVVGLVEAKASQAENVAFAIPATDAAPLLRGWQEAPRPVSADRECGNPWGPDGVEAVVTEESGHPDGPGIAQAFRTYADGINTGDYASAYGVLSPAAQRLTTLGRFSRGEASSYIVGLVVTDVAGHPSGRRDTVEVRFRSVQDPEIGGTGQSCSDWSMTYRMIFDGSGWRIDRATPHPGSPAQC